MSKRAATKTGLILLRYVFIATGEDEVFHVPKHSKLGSVPSQTSTEDDQALRHHASTLKWDPSTEPLSICRHRAEKDLLTVHNIVDIL